MHFFNVLEKNAAAARDRGGGAAAAAPRWTFLIQRSKPKVFNF